jgi:hypothetical protein
MIIVPNTQCVELVQAMRMETKEVLSANVPNTRFIL